MILIIYIPAYNEGKNIKTVINALPRKIQGIDEIKYLVVDDGSTDNTVEVSEKCGAKVVSHGLNRGVGVAFQTAVNYVLDKQVDLLVSIDADRQFDPKQIEDIIKPILLNEADMVTGNRFNNGMPKDMPKIKYWGNKKMSKLISLISGKKFQDVSCGFRAYNREALLRLNLLGSFTYTQETIMDLVFKGLRVMEYPVKVFYFKERKSRVAGSILKYVVKTLKIILRSFRDYKPMVFFGGAGLSMFGIGFVFIIFLFTHYFINGMFTPYKSFGFIGLGFLLVGLIFLLVALLADMFVRIRINQEKIIYQLKKGGYEKRQ